MEEVFWEFMKLFRRIYNIIHKIKEFKWTFHSSAVLTLIKVGFLDFPKIYLLVPRSS